MTTTNYSSIWEGVAIALMDKDQEPLIYTTNFMTCKDLAYLSAYSYPQNKVYTFKSWDMFSQTETQSMNNSLVRKEGHLKIFLTIQISWALRLVGK